MTTAQALENVLNAWVNGRKVRDGIPLTIRQQAEQALLTADAQATVEALQREREQWVQAVGLASTCAGDMEIDVTKPIEMMQVVCQRFATLTAALDAEREKGKETQNEFGAKSKIEAKTEANNRKIIK